MPCPDKASFNPRSHAGSDKQTRQEVILSPCFNPRSHAGSDSLPLRAPIKVSPFQSTLPRGERRYLFPGDGIKEGVSIHAPTRGATFLTVEDQIIFHVSIHAPTRGATADRVQPGRRIPVSIHAPTRGATIGQGQGNAFGQFQSTLPRGERPCVHSQRPSTSCFNPRSHAGSDRLFRAYCCSPYCFNPRSHAGSDDKGSALFDNRACFNPRSHAGSDQFRC